MRKYPHALFPCISLFLALATLLGVIKLGLLPLLFSGMLTYAFADKLAVQLLRITSYSKIASFVTLMAIVLLAITAVVWGGVHSASSLIDDPATITNSVSTVFTKARASLPESLLKYIPVDVSEAQAQLIVLLKDNLEAIKSLGVDAGKGFIFVLMGIVIGGMVFLGKESKSSDKPLASHLALSAKRFAEAFERVFFAQVKISAINTAVLAVYLMVILPLVGIHLPLAKTMVATSFFVCLIPVAGNLVSNSFLVLISMTHSVWLAMASLLLMVVIHKLEYFLSAKIIGSTIKAKAWEVLCVMLAMEALFGVAGILVAPIYYAYVKLELADMDLI